jgi:2-polyprenyl-3-methyl-5-hydroxy-6-metoxy-1,4-benzoquinol methylase
MMRPRGSHQSVNEFIAGLARGKRVLDVGCVAHEAEAEQQDYWLHRIIAQTAVSVMGLDILEKEVELLRQRGYHMVGGNACTVDLSKTFELIVAGEFIEHVDAPGEFLQNMKRHLAPDGRLVLTTPNAFFALHFAESIFASPYRRWNQEHVCWYCYFTLENLLRRNGMKICDCIYFARGKTQAVLSRLRLPCPRLLAGTIVAVAEVA